MADELTEKLRRAVPALIASWNAGDMEQLRDLLADDVVQLSPYAADTNGRLVGPDAIIRFNRERQKESPLRELVEILVGLDAVTLVLRDDRGLLTWRLELAADQKITRISTSYSVDRDYAGTRHVLHRQPDSEVDPRDRKQRIVQAISAYNDGDFDTVAETFTEDVEICSPLLESVYGRRGPLRGKPKVIEHMRLSRADSPFDLELRDILLGDKAMTIMMDSPTGPVAWTVEETADGRVSRIISTFSVGKAFGDHHDDVA